MSARAKKNPAGGKYDRCVRDVKKRGGANPYAVCATVGKKKRGKRKNPLGSTVLLEAAQPVLQRAGAKLHLIPSAKRKKKNGKRKNPAVRKNSLEGSQAAFERFHGRPSEETVTIRTPVHEHKYLAACGELVSVVIRGARGKIRLRNFGGALLCQNEKQDRPQLFIEGGDQSVDIRMFGIVAPVHEFETLGELVACEYYTIKDHLGDEGGEAIYKHRLKKVRIRSYPTVVYDTVNALLYLAGGNYSIEPEGIRD